MGKKHVTSRTPGEASGVPRAGSRSKNSAKPKSQASRCVWHVWEGRVLAGVTEKLVSWGLTLNNSGDAENSLPLRVLDPCGPTEIRVLSVHGPGECHRLVRNQAIRNRKVPQDQHRHFSLTALCQLGPQGWNPRVYTWTILSFTSYDSSHLVCLRYLSNETQCDPSYHGESQEIV